jgi:hypothetical protein
MEGFLAQRPGYPRSGAAASGHTRSVLVLVLLAIAFLPGETNSSSTVSDYPDCVVVGEARSTPAKIREVLELLEEVSCFSREHGEVGPPDVFSG